MSDPSTVAMDNHLQRYENSDAGNDSDTHTPGGDEDTEETTFWGVVFADTTHPFPNNVRVSLHSEVCKSIYSVHSRVCMPACGCMALAAADGVVCRKAPFLQTYTSYKRIPHFLPVGSTS